MRDLVYELRISAIFPLIMLCLSLVGLRLGSMIAASLALAADLLLKLTGESLEPQFASSITEAVLVTIHFILPFVIGAIMFRTLPVYQEWFKRRKLSELIGLFGLALFFLSIKRDWSLDVGAGLMMVLGLTVEQFSKILTVAPIQFLGKISFSLYLVHVPIIVAFTHVLYSRVASDFILMIAISISLLFATIFYFLVENPSSRFGHNLYRRIVAS